MYMYNVYYLCVCLYGARDLLVWQNLLPVKPTCSDSELIDDSSKSSSWSPRVSVSANDDSDHLTSGQTSPKRTANKFSRGMTRGDC